MRIATHENGNEYRPATSADVTRCSSRGCGLPASVRRYHTGASYVAAPRADVGVPDGEVLFCTLHDPLVPARLNLSGRMVVVTDGEVDA